MYRAITLKAMREGVPMDDSKKLVAVAKKASIRLVGPPEKQKVFLDGKNVTQAIREPELTRNVFHVAQEAGIRREMVKKQRSMGKDGGAVMEGRDIGTKVFPKADYKFYFEADEALRAKRRLRELVAAGKAASFQKVFKDLKVRDNSDYKRKEGPLRKAKDAFVIDTTPLTIEETADKMLAIIQSNSLDGRRLKAHRGW